MSIGGFFYAHVEPISWSWAPHEIFVRVVEDPDADRPFSTCPDQHEAGMYAPSFDLWDAGALLDFLFQANAKQEGKSWGTLMLPLNLRLPKDTDTHFLH